MAKVPFSKLEAKLNECACGVSYGNLNGDNVYFEVRHYLPIKEKLDMVTRIINQSVDANGFYNPMRVKIYMVLEIVYAYTNLSFTAKQKEDPFKLYDLIVGNGIFYEIIQSIREEDWAEIKENVWSTIDNIYKYRNSVKGILDAVAADYEGLNLDALTIKENLSNPENLNLLRDVLTKLG